MNLGQPGLHGGGDLEGGVVHAEWLENVGTHVFAEALTADFFNHLAGPINVDAVVPAVAGVETEGCEQGGV